jgi:thiol-disulfide isomerase/thioredoxin
MAPVYQSFDLRACPKWTKKGIVASVRPSLLRFLAQIGMLVAISTCVALLVDTLGLTPAYCGGTGGCHAVKLAARRVLGTVPLPLLGLVAFVGLLGMTTCQRGRRVRRAEGLGAILSGTGGVALLLVQAVVLESYCPLCVTVDVAAIAACVALLISRRGASSDEAPQWLHPVTMGALVAVAGIAPVAFPHFRPVAPMPPALSQFERPSRTSVIEFVDLSCEHCRALYPTLERLRAQQGDRIHFVRLHAPKASHQRARSAARLLACLSSDIARREKLEAALFRSPDLERSSLETAAGAVGMSREQVAACWSDPASSSRIDANLELLESLGVYGLPITYVAGERIMGALPLAVYEAALVKVRRTSRLGSGNSMTFAFCTLMALLVFGIYAIGRRAVVSRTES